MGLAGASVYKYTTSLCAMPTKIRQQQTPQEIHSAAPRSDAARDEIMTVADDHPIPVLRLPCGLRFKRSSVLAWLDSQETPKAQ